MGERKVVNKYYPSDFDPSKLSRPQRSKNGQIKVRMMLPLSIRRNACGNYIYKGTKFNSRMEDVVGETYLGIRVFRFYFKCPKCSAELIIKTDPRNSDYIVESGKMRNFEPWRANDEAVEGEKRRRTEMADGMKSLENRTLAAKREMDIEVVLHEMKSINSRHAAVSTDAMLQVLQRATAVKEGKLEEEDEALTKSISFHTSRNFVQRIKHEDLTQTDAGDDESLHSALKKRKFSEESLNKPTDSLTEATSSDKSNNRGNYVGSQDRSASFVRIVVVKRVAPTSSTGLELVSQNYESSDDGD